MLSQSPCTALTAGSCCAKGLSLGSEKQLEFHWSFEPIMQWGIFWRTNQKRVMPANLRPCLIPHWQSYCHRARTVQQSMTTGIRPRELLRSHIKILHIWIWCTNSMFMMKNKKLSFQNLQVTSDVINLKIIVSVKMPIWIQKMPKITNEVIMCIINVW